MNMGRADPREYFRVKQIETYRGGTINPQVSGSPIETYGILRNLIPDSDSKNKEKLEGLVVDYFEWQIRETKNIFNRQKVYGKIIFWTVISLVATGIVFSVIQFLNAFQLGKLEQLHTELAIQSGNLALSTSLVGGFVLIVSLAFFYLFLRFVYKGDFPPSDVYTAFNSLNSKEKQNK
jgi:hypothetical protein